MTMETIGDFVQQNNSSPLNGPTVDIDSIVSFHKVALRNVIRLLNNEPSLVGLTVINAEGKVEGTVSRHGLRNYLRQQDKEEGGHAERDLIGHLAGIISPVPFYRCDNSLHPLYQRFSVTRPKCRTCGRLMQEIEGEEDV